MNKQAGWRDHFLSQREIDKMLSTVSSSKQQIPDIAPGLREIYTKYFVFVDAVKQDFIDRGIKIELRDVRREDTYKYFLHTARSMHSPVFLFKAQGKNGMVIEDSVTNCLLGINKYTRIMGKDLLESVRKNLENLLEIKISRLKKQKISKSVIETTENLEKLCDSKHVVVAYMGLEMSCYPKKGGISIVTPRGIY